MAMIIAPKGRDIPAGPEKNNPYWQMQEARYRIQDPAIPITIKRRDRGGMLFHDTSESIAVHTSTSVPNVQRITDSAVLPV